MGLIFETFSWTCKFVIAQFIPNFFEKDKISVENVKLRYRLEMGHIAILLTLCMDFMYASQNRIIVELISEKFDSSLNI